MIKYIVNADDFGLNKNYTDAIMIAFEKNIITDTTMVANGEAYEYALEKIKTTNIGDKVGIHFNITEGVPLTEGIKKNPRFCVDGKFVYTIKRLDKLSEQDKQDVYNELTAQIERLIKDGVSLTHADSHHHVHNGIDVQPIVIRVCKEHGITKIRKHKNLGKISFFKKIVKWHYNRLLKKKGFTMVDWFGLIDNIPEVPDNSTCEIMVHPAFNEEGIIIDKQGIDYLGEKLTLDLSKDANVKLISYKEL